MAVTLQQPSALTDQQEPLANASWAQAKAQGLRSVLFQAQNGPDVNDSGPAAWTTDFDLAPAKAAGLAAGVWGVSYYSARWYVDGKALAAQAVKLHADLLLADIEPLRENMSGKSMQPFVQGCRDGGWTGPISLTTLGCPDNPRTAVNPGGNDYNLDSASFVATGGSVLPQAYYNAHGYLDDLANPGAAPSGYHPRLCRDYWLAKGVPPNRLSLMIELAFEHSRLDGQAWRALLQAVGLGPRVSIFQFQDAALADWQALAPVMQAPPPGTPDPATRMRMIADATAWVTAADAQGLDSTQARIRSALEILQTKEQPWNADRAALYASIHATWLKGHL